MKLVCLLLSAGLVWADGPIGSFQVAAAPGRSNIVVNPATDSVVPQVVDGAGWSTSFFLTNLDGTKSIFWQIFFFTDQGQAVNLPIAGSGPASFLFGELPPNWSVRFETPGTAAGLTQGWAAIATFDRPPDRPGATQVTDRIGGLATFRQRVAGRPDFEAVVPISPATETRFVMPFDNRAGFSTGVAWLNPDRTVPALVEVTIRQDDATIIQQDSFTIPPGSKLVFSMPERYVLASGRSGRMQVSTTARMLAGLGLRFNPGGAFTSFHALSFVP